METYEVLVQGVGLIATPALIIGAILGIIKGLHIYHERLTKKIVLEYLKTLQND